ncbi:hypothetical protein Pdw03_6432 [Penicillium digitatum]|nr:hypothetical protein Pdw03_6432 [Penicillium digitatum]
MKELWIRRYQVYLGQEDRALRIDNKGLEIRYLYHEIVFQAFLYVFSMLNLLPSFCILEGIDQDLFYLLSIMNGHAACPKCGAAADGAGKSCGACGATCPV